MKNTYLKKAGDSILFDGEYMELYIPEYYYETGIAIDKGNIVEYIGLVNFKIFKNPDSDVGALETLNFPSMMSSKPSSIISKELELVKGAGVDKYRILKFFKNDILMVSTSVVQSVDNSEIFIRLLNSGKIPNTIPYEQIIHLFLKNLEINNMNLNVSSMLLETIVSEMCRYKEDLSIPFRKIIGKNPKISQLDYTPVNIREVCSYNATFNAVTFEDINSMLTTSVNKKRYKKREAYSPVENILKY